MRVRFVHHSAFVVELDEHVLIFDYFNGDRVNGYNFLGSLPEYTADSDLYFFASHKHADHFDMDILRLKDKYPKAKFILSKDCKMSSHFLSKHGIDPSINESITYVTGLKTYNVDDLIIKTLLSTDAGVAFIVNCEDKNIYHAGDLNDWYIEGAGDINNGKMKRVYQHEIKKIKDFIDVAFIPVDPRLGDHIYDGFDFFMKTVDVKYAFPMHCWQQYDLIDGYMNRISNPAFLGRIIKPTHENEEFVLE